ncbi:hypothetical protein ACH2GM_006214 [Pseudomonas aeruginosa]|jgi:hypothetical protein|uniref:hypothetical protein n=1 Tax=Pseudomonas TaxID=286 RepID=UPI0015FD18E0|nr:MULTISPECIES: hypothetical protein [Pseudomonas]EKT8672215.1 hypothetical protein [Pseudomonas aeruginosa]MBA6127744.1 hypothetical protein [Pseudomonas juntendi]MCE0940468.1 hypothetical protein [Pseudomonas kurunegalensis]
MVRLIAFVHALVLLAVLFLVARSDFAHHYGYLGVVVAIIGMVLSGRSQTRLGKAIALWLIVPGVAATAGWQFVHLLA